MAGPLAIIAGVGMGIMSLLGVPAARDILSRSIYRLTPLALPQQNDLVAMRFREEINNDEYLKYSRENGFNVDWANRIYNTAEQYLNLGELIASWRRGIITESILDNNLERLGFGKDNVAILKKVTEFFPAPPDLIRFAVREIYTPTIREKFGMDLDFPPEFLQNAAKAGLPEQIARDFWASHWILPSPLQGNRMLHRGIIDEDEHEKLLKALDIMPFWRTKMKALSYNPLTRVDVRRMYGLDVLDIAGVNKAYRDIGYNEENAQAMTEFTVKFENDENKGITRASVVSAYKKGAISEDDLVKYLKALRFSDGVVSFWANFAINEKVGSEIDDMIDIEVGSYVEGIINLKTLLSNLAGFGLPDLYIQNVVRKAALKRKGKIKLPSKQDLIGWMGKGIIDANIFTLYMLESGYRQQDIGLYIDATLSVPEGGPPEV